MGTLDLKGIYRYDETDDEATHSDLLNLGMQSISDAMTYFSGPAVRRAALSPAPEGAFWQDTDGGKRLYSASPTGTWRLHSGYVFEGAKAWTYTVAPFYARQVIIDLPTVIDTTETIHCAVIGASGYNFVTLSSLTRHADRTTVSVQYGQLSNSNVQTAFTMLWSVVRVGA